MGPPSTSTRPPREAGPKYKSKRLRRYVYVVLVRGEEANGREGIYVDGVYSSLERANEAVSHHAGENGKGTPGEDGRMWVRGRSGMEVGEGEVHVAK